MISRLDQVSHLPVQLSRGGRDLEAFRAARFERSSFSRDQLHLWSRCKFSEAICRASVLLIKCCNACQGYLATSNYKQ